MIAGSGNGKGQETLTERLTTLFNAHSGRREAIALLLSTATLVLDHRRPQQLASQEIIMSAQAAVPLMWNLYFDGGLREVREILPPYLFHITAIIEDRQQPDTVRHEAITLASKAHQLASLISCQANQMQHATAHAQQAIVLGEMVEDGNLIAAGHIRRAIVLFYEHNTQARTKAYQTALAQYPHISPLIAARVGLGLAECSACEQQYDAAMRYLEYARRTFPASPQEDTAYPYTHFGSSWLINEGRTLMQFDAYRERAIEVMSSELPSLNRQQPEWMEVTTSIARAAALQGEAELCAESIRGAITVARASSNLLRQREASEAFNAASQTVRQSPYMREVAQLL